MSRIVHYEHRYKKPPRKKPKKPPLDVPVVVVRAEPTRRKPAPEEAEGPRNRPSSPSGNRGEGL
jgi:hypothetical protein